MPAASLLALLDDIATVLDDVAALSKVAARKVTGVLGDDLALNAEQVSGVRAARELPVVWGVCKGSFRNKLILVPAALGISAFIPWLVTPLLMVGGAYLCLEGFEKVAHRFLHRASDAAKPPAAPSTPRPRADLSTLERLKIRGAIRTDFILSAEIITITLGTVSSEPFLRQVAVLCIVAVAMTIGVYGAVAAIVKLDDAGLILARIPGQRPPARALRGIGRILLKAAPWLMKTLAITGTIAMFLVGGGILAHGIPRVSHGVHELAAAAATVPLAGGLLRGLAPHLAQALVGILAGAACTAIVAAGKKLVGRVRRNERS